MGDPIDISWRGNSVGTLEEPEYETVSPTSVKVRGRWCPGSTPYAGAFGRALQESDHIRVTIGGSGAPGGWPRRQAWFSLDRRRGQGWLLIEPTLSEE
jgi:hypothetical protein